MATETAQTLRPVYQVIADGLAANGVGATFGLMGEDTADLITDLDRVGVPYYAARHENVALNMADGYSAMTGLGVCILSRGPGVTNATTAAATAARRGNRVLILSGDMPAGSGSFAGAMKKVDHAGLCRILGIEFRSPRASDELAGCFEEAVALARGGQVTMLAVPVDVLSASTAETPAPVPIGDGASVPPPLDSDQLAEIVGLLDRARRPLILAGRGAALAGARGVLEELASRTGALLGTSMGAKDLFRGSPLDVGVVGGFSSPLTRELLKDIDCALVFGARLSDFTVAQGRVLQNIPVVQFDIDLKPPSSKVDVSLALVADAAGAAEQLLAVLPPANGGARALHEPDVLQRVAQCHTYQEDDVSRASEIDPRVLAVALDGLLPPERTILTDGGHCMGFPAMHMRVTDPSHYLLYDGIGSIGTGLGTAMGTAIGRPESPMVFCAGDGSLAMTMGDLETVVRHDLPMVIVVFNDGAYGAERHFLDLAGHPNGRSIFGNIDFAAVARGLGMEAATIRTLDDLRAHEPALNEPRTHPLLLDCKIAGEVRSRWMEEF